MPNDAKLGLVLGVGLVIALAVVFFQRDQTPVESGEMSASAVQPKPVAKPKKSSGESPRKPVKAKPSSLPTETEDAVETSATTSDNRSILNSIQPAAGTVLPDLRPVPPR